MFLCDLVSSFSLFFFGLFKHSSSVCFVSSLVIVILRTDGEERKLVAVFK